MRTGAAVALFTLITVAVAPAQMRGGMGAPVGGSGVTIGFAPRSGPSSPLRNNFIPFIPGSFYPDGWLGDYYSAMAQPPTVVVVQSAPPSPPVREEPRHSAEPLMIEWQGDRYVRYSTSEVGANARIAQLDYSTPAASTSNSSADRAATRAPAALVFRDGHEQEVSNYTIVNRVMYVGSDYWSSGAWQQRIQMADLDIPATLKLNRDRGIKFILPTMPNEVVTRP
jgi:hypothetical protein